ncbi:hypothetical protein [Actibacterium sp. MT2.3-13A]|uniref:hypothetical protein n=1 Tax=Actibacterium sp. MT2.3-13A TaxID=2828332 RepID=UPI001BA6A383|nr:hypothetical protein [Actibacterium sp. MT2.3-13A]
MEKIAQFPNQPAQDALKILEEAWAYYTPAPYVAAKGADRPEPQLFAYYDAA